jgi:hypothetical protein
MTKTEAIKLLGGTVGAASRAIGVSSSAVSLWPDELPARIADRVQAALWRISQGMQAATVSEPTDSDATAKATV